MSNGVPRALAAMVRVALGGLAVACVGCEQCRETSTVILDSTDTVACCAVVSHRIKSPGRLSVTATNATSTARLTIRLYPEVCGAADLNISCTVVKRLDGAGSVALAPPTYGGTGSDFVVEISNESTQAAAVSVKATDTSVCPIGFLL